MSEIGHRGRTDAVTIAEGKGLVCFFPRENELFLDIDQKDWTGDNLHELMDLLADSKWAVDPDTEILVTRSSGGNKHAYIRTAKKIAPLERLMIQAALGSDPKKELLSFSRLVRYKSKNAYCCLFETQKSAKRVNEWREEADEDDIPF